MTNKFRIALMLGMAAAPLAAQAPAPPVQASPGSPAPAASAIEGMYETRIREVASVLMLTRDGRFIWFFSSGALDLYGAGRWTLGADGAVTLDSDPAVVPPQLELIGRSYDPQVGAAVRLACDSGEVSNFMTPVIFRRGAEPEGHRFERLEARVGQDAARPVEAIQIVSGPFDFGSDRIPVTPEANVFTFRFHPNDLGYEGFAGQRASVANGVLTMNWRGEAIQYHRTGTADGQEMPQLPRAERPVPDAAPVALTVSIGEGVDALRARAGEGLVVREEDRMVAARGPVDLRLTIGEHSIDLGRTNGGRRPLMVFDSYDSGMVDGLGFETGELQTLDSALARAQALQAWLAQAGFRPSSEQGDDPPFSTVGVIVGEPAVATDWPSARRALADEQRAIAEMNLYVLRTQDHLAAVKLINVRRTEAERCAHSSLTGPEWRLDVAILRSRTPA